MIIYASKYGSTKAYADLLGERLELPTVSFDEVTSISSDLVIFLGSVFAGKLHGLSDLLPLIPRSARLIVTSVGMSNPNLAGVRAKLDAAIASQLNGRGADVFHLRGIIDYPNLKLHHRAMLSAVHKKMIAIPREKRDEAVTDFLDSYGRKADYFDPASLTPIVEAARA